MRRYLFDLPASGPAGCFPRLGTSCLVLSACRYARILWYLVLGLHLRSSPRLFGLLSPWLSAFPAFRLGLTWLSRLASRLCPSGTCPSLLPGPMMLYSCRYIPCPLLASPAWTLLDPLKPVQQLLLLLLLAAHHHSTTTAPPQHPQRCKHPHLRLSDQPWAWPRSWCRVTDLFPSTLSHSTCFLLLFSFIPATDRLCRTS
jgi:hypothetical protein